MSVGTCEWSYAMIDIVNALISASLRIEFLHEFPLIFYPANPLPARGKDGMSRLPGEKLPLTFSIRAVKE
jgi:hypothetical protein